MDNPKKSGSYFSGICIGECGGLCCDPWWGIISYTMVKDGGLSGLNNFRDEVIKGLKIRAKRIRDAYVTNEDTSRPLFGSPERYNASIRNIKAKGNRFTIEILAMFAFRCRYLSDEKVCAIHPAVLGGKDIRPPQCGYLGTPDARPGEKGYCRVIDAAEGKSLSAVTAAIETEKDAVSKSYRDGVKTVEEAADSIINGFKDYCSRNFRQLSPRETPAVPGRNDPCWCGSSMKYKKCHGRS